MTEAKLLANALFNMPTMEVDITVLDKASAELLRLSAVNKELTAINAKLTEVNVELVKAIKDQRSLNSTVLEKEKQGENNG